jgi:4-amino-4-deoxy-L-arabinose transferase-like glycosyltransferase
LPSLRQRARRWAPWLPELACIILGCVLRASMLTRYPMDRGYDFISHWKYVEWVAQHWTLPHIYWSRETYHEPLYYFAAAAALKLGIAVPLVSIVAGCARLVVFAVALVLIFPRRRLLRVVALALAAVLPASIHPDGMINSEALLGLFTAAFLLAACVALSNEGRARWRWALAAGVLASLALMTKISVLTCIAAVGVAALVDAFGARDLRSGARRIAPFVAALAILLAATGWYFERNHRLYGKAFLSGFDTRDHDAIVPIEHVPVWKRRSPGYVLGWTFDVVGNPRWPSGYQPSPRFFPTLVATTFCDYYRYGFAPEADISRSRIAATTWTLARLSVAAGVYIAFLTAVAWLFALVAAWRHRRCGLLALLFAPAFAVAGQLAFAWKYAVDWQGPVKGVYVQFAALPMCALFALAVDECWRRKGAWRAAAVVGFVALAFVAAYSMYGRFTSRVVSPLR